MELWLHVFRYSIKKYEERKSYKDWEKEQSSKDNNKWQLLKAWRYKFSENSNSYFSTYSQSKSD
jgi:hypothetical protein